MGGLFDAPGADPVPRDGHEEKAHLDRLRRLADDCAHTVGAALPHLSTEQTAHDMDALRAALGEPTIGFLGVSYGSYLGAAYAAAHPHRVGRMVLDSVVGPWSWHDFDVRQARATAPPTRHPLPPGWHATPTATASATPLAPSASPTPAYAPASRVIPSTASAPPTSTAPSTALSAAPSAGPPSATACTATCATARSPGYAPPRTSPGPRPVPTKPPTAS